MLWNVWRVAQWPKLIVDDMHNNMPDLTRDQYWDNAAFELPYTLAVANKALDPSNFDKGSANGVRWAPW